MIITTWPMLVRIMITSPLSLQTIKYSIIKHYQGQVQLGTITTSCSTTSSRLNQPTTAQGPSSPHNSRFTRCHSSTTNSWALQAPITTTSSHLWLHHTTASPPLYPLNWWASNHHMTSWRQQVIIMIRSMRSHQLTSKRDSATTRMRRLSEHEYK